MNSLKWNEKMLKFYNKSTENKSTSYIDCLCWGGYFQLFNFIDNVGKHEHSNEEKFWVYILGFRFLRFFLLKFLLLRPKDFYLLLLYCFLEIISIIFLFTRSYSIRKI